MFKKVIKIEKAGEIVCDHCGWKNENVPFKEYKKYVNKPTIKIEED
jgi:C4-type Zn-finger protein